MDSETRLDIKEQLKLVPKKPGCYQMYNSDGTIIYVGKAKILQNRLKSYFTGAHDAKTTQMVSCVKHFEYIITSSEKEALLLEQNLIKKYRPKYNILLMDDKSYPYITVTNEPNPRLIVTRDIDTSKRKAKGEVYGPFPDVKACRNTVDVLNKILPFRKCHTIPKKACLYYYLNQCLAPCINKIEKSEYYVLRQKTYEYLKKGDSELINILSLKMEEASNNLEFEKALEYRNMINSLNTILENQKITLTDGVNRDIFGFYVKDNIISIQVFHMRYGKITERKGEVFDIYDSPTDAFMTYILQFYTNHPNLYPQEVLIPYIQDKETLEEALGIKLIIPVIATKKKLVDLVCDNAKNNLENLLTTRLRKIERTSDTLVELGKILGINTPRVIELLDNSNIQGASSVSAMVTYIDGVKVPSRYRKYKIKTVEGADDFHTMQEVLTRRYKRVISDNLEKCDLILVDGGIPQVKAAKMALKQLNITDINVAGLVKDDKHRTRAIVNDKLVECDIKKNSNLYLLLEAMQDEVHRFAITFFKKVHSESMLSSSLDKIKGIGKARKRKLVENFETIDDIKNAEKEKLKALGIPDDVINNIKNDLSL